MKILVIGTGTIGGPVVKALERNHEVIVASRHSSAIHVDLDDPDSIRAMYAEVGAIDAVVSVAGNAAFAPLEKLSDDDVQLGVKSKLLGQVNLVRYGLQSVRDGGSFTITTGILAQHPMPGTAAITMVNIGLEGFVHAAALELDRGRRINAVSPGWVAETLTAMGRDPSGGTPAADVAKAYVRAVEGSDNGQVIGASGS